MFTDGDLGSVAGCAVEVFVLGSLVKNLVRRWCSNCYWKHVICSLMKSQITLIDGKVRSVASYLKIGNQIKLSGGFD